MTAAVTIGMPIRNGAEYVEEAIRSLLAQTEGDFILHISDNCWDDSTPPDLRAARGGRSPHPLRASGA